jgi:small GTP-binding protein
MTVIQKKVCLLGDFAVGKTSLVRRYVEGKFDDKYMSTIGVKISRRTIVRDDITLNLLIWDLAGGEDFDQMTSRYLLGAAGALIVCDLTRQKTIKTMTDYAKQLQEQQPEAALVLAANKADLVAERVIDDETMTAVGRQLEAPFLLTSAKDGQNVEEAFELLADRLPS